MLRIRHMSSSLFFYKEGDEMWLVTALSTRRQYSPFLYLYTTVELIFTFFLYPEQVDTYLSERESNKRKPQQHSQQGSEDDNKNYNIRNDTATIKHTLTKKGWFTHRWGPVSQIFLQFVVSTIELVWLTGWLFHREARTLWKTSKICYW